MMRAVDDQLVMPMTTTIDEECQSASRRSPSSRPEDVLDDRSEDQRQDERGDDEEEVRHAHEERVGPPADEAAEDADHRPEQRP